MMNPYVGPRTFTQAESHLFFGREQEARDLFSRVISERLLLFYATSGAGKSSILQTRLMPKLQEQGWIVLPVARVSGALPTGIAHVPNIYRFNLMLSLDRSQRDPQRLVDLSLAQFLRQLSSDDGETFYYDDALTEAETASSTTPYILIIDQFEELLTTHAPLWPQRAEFLRELNETLRADPMLSVLLTLREDYVAALDPYAQLLDNSLRARFYMTRMGYEAALTAVSEPAKLGQRPFTEDAARQLVANLSQVKSNQPSPLPLSQKERGDKKLPLPSGEGWGEGQGEGHGQFIEPVQLQVVCYQLWEKLVSATADRAPEAITVADLERYGNVDNALASFYEQVLRQVLPLYPQVAEAELRQWFDQQLITPAQTRGLVFQGPATSEGMPNEVVQALSSAYLLRTDQRAGGQWVELVHDRFIEPILQANRRWLSQNPLMNAAQAWDKAGRPEALLYGDQPLQEAKRQPQAGALVTAFIQASEKAEQARLQQLRNNRRLQGLVFALGFLLLVAMGAMVYAVQQATLANKQKHFAAIAADRADEQATLANARALLAQSKEVANEKPLLGIRLALESAAIAPPEMTDEISKTLRQQLSLGRVTQLGQDVTWIYTTPLTSTILVVHDTQSSTLRNLTTWKVITLSGKVHVQQYSDDRGVYYSPQNNGDFVVRYDNLPGELRSAQGQHVITLSGQVSQDNGVYYSPQNNGDFVVNYLDLPGELRLAQDREVITLSGQVSQYYGAVNYSPQNNGDFVVRYDNNISSELRSAQGREVITLSGQLKDGGVYYSPENNVDFVVKYDNLPGELRLAQGRKVITLSGLISQYSEAVYYSPQNNGDFVVSYDNNISSELRSAQDRQVITLSGHVNEVFDSPQNNGDFVVSYYNLPGELRTAQGHEVIILSGQVNKVNYSPQNNGDFVVSYYNNISSELRSTQGREVITLSGQVYQLYEEAANYSPQNNGDFVVRYDNLPGELRSAQGRHVITLSGQVNYNGVYYSPQNNGDFVVIYSNLSGELRSAQGRGVITLSGKVNGVVYSPQNKGDFVVSYYDAPGELRSAQGRREVITLSGKVNGVVYSPQGSYFLAQYADGTAEVWQANPTWLLTQLGLGLENFGRSYIFDEAHDQLIVWYSDRRAYLVDLAMLKAMRPESSLADLQQVGCEALRRNALWLNEAEVAPYLFGEKGRGCR